VDRLGLDLARFTEAELLEDPSRRNIPVPDTRPQPPVARFACPRNNRPGSLGRVTVSVNRTQQLVGQLGRVKGAIPVSGQSAVPDDVTSALPLHSQELRSHNSRKMAASSSMLGRKVNRSVSKCSGAPAANMLEVSQLPRCRMTVRLRNGRRRATYPYGAIGQSSG
jgi:hypothetical protein